jgi:hypothetical protein
MHLEVGQLSFAGSWLPGRSTKLALHIPAPGAIRARFPRESNMKRMSLFVLAIVALSVVLTLVATHSQGVAAQSQQGPSVTVVNTEDHPVPVTGTVRDADNPARLAYQESMTLSFNVGSFAVGEFFSDVPDGKLLVIEHVSVDALLPVGQIATATMVTHLGPLITDGVGHHLVMHAQAPGGFVASQLVRLYEKLRPGINVYRTSGSGTGTAVAAISGYLIDIP